MNKNIVQKKKKLLWVGKLAGAFLGDQGEGVDFFSDPEGGFEFLFMPHWKTVLINVIKRLFS